MAMIIDVPGIIYSLLCGFFGAPTLPWYQLLFGYVMPMGLVFFTLVDFFSLMTFLSKRTAYVVSGIIALIGFQLGLCRAYNEMIQTMFGPFIGDMSMWLAMFTTVLFLGAIFMTVNHAVVMFKISMAAKDSLKELVTGTKTMWRVGNRVDTLAKNQMGGQQQQQPPTH
ncbi:MAG: hypothetical protein V1820_03170 [archaeon]